MSLLDIARPSGLHRAVDEVHRLRHLLAKAHAGLGLMRYQLDQANAGRDAANAKVSELGEVTAQLAEATQQLRAQTAELRELRAFYANATKVGDLTAHPAVAETQPIPVLPLHLSPLAGTSPSHVPGA
jgi:hypothetical protein